MTNIVYKLINREKEKLGVFPCYYIGSKLNYKPGKYWGSSKHPLLIKELNDRISAFEMIILETVIDKNELTAREQQWQKKEEVVANVKYYNLNYARDAFSSVGYKWSHDPVSLLKGYFPEHKIPTGWILGKTPETAIKRQNKLNSETGLKRGDPKLNEIIAERTKENTRKGNNHPECREWTLIDPEGNRHIVLGLHEFCKQFNLSATSLQYSINTKRPIKKGNSKGWYVLSKK